MGIEKINQLWQEVKLRAVGMNQARKLYGVIVRSVGKKDARQMAKMELAMLLDDNECKYKQLKVLESVIENLCMQIPKVKKIIVIKGIGLMSVASFFAQVGDIKHFDSPKQIQSL